MQQDVLYCVVFILFCTLPKTISIQGVRQYASCINVNDVYIISAVRTPIGCLQGKLSSLNAVQLGSKALTAAVEKSRVSKEEVQEILLGNTFQAGLGQNPAHQIALFSGLSNSIISTNINKLCSSGMRAVISACQVIASKTHEVVAAGGTESLSNVPYFLRRQKMRLGHLCLKDMIIADGLNDMFEQMDITCFAEETVKEYEFTRQDQDDFALSSYEKAAQAQKDKIFESEMVPIVFSQKKGEEEIMCEDEEIKRLQADKFRELPPETGKDGTITVGNSAGLGDGAAMMILASGNYVIKKNLTPIAKIVAYAEASVDPKKFVIAPSVAIPKALVRANLTAENIAFWEISETFAVSVLLNAKSLSIDLKKINIHGGAISLGHPFGMTGARIIVHLAHILRSGEIGCACICHGSGGASSVIIEKI